MGTWEPGPGVVELPDGRLVRGRGLREPQPDGDPPDFGVYLQARDPGPFAWEHRWVRWPDFRVPRSTPETIAALREAFDRSTTERVELACSGGIGRTGTAMAVLAMLAGIESADAVAWVRDHYRPHAVETPGQRRWLRHLDL